ncbi:nuclease (SNase-like) [Synechococcus sp. BIOS-E4-1]|uniref:thermonuclease family protein n=1 Tax=Synechococcus sp. BIOS-E4-1 TaxID=1400864 RepID=UPI001644C6E4|nr:thermonuclease family protein [Synechococcus sp. BIOS-E4-1]QNI53993.1 nuclease (SNase-like) [Synechococcus sp. BIOS-E4-1]
MMLAALASVLISSCYDGDTCRSNSGEKIRLACIDTPELRGKRANPVPAKAARDYLRRLVVGRDVGIRRITKDRYGRTVAELFVDGSNVQQQLVAAGHADIYWKYAHQCGWTR